MSESPDLSGLTEPSRDGADTRVRLQKLMAGAGVASRRASEEMIEEGRVKVNGRVVRDLPVLVEPGKDRVTVDGREIAGKRERRVYVMLHKPRFTVTTANDPDGRRTVSELVQHPTGVRLYPVGRLDYETMGLLLMTNDGELANRLTHPRYGVHKRYRAIVKGALTPEEVEELERGVHLAVRRDGRTVGGERTGGANLSIVRRERERTVLDIELTEGRNRQVRRMLASVGHRVKKLTRIEMGPLRLKGLRLGEWRELTRGEIDALRRAARRGERQARGQSKGRGQSDRKRSARRAS